MTGGILAVARQLADSVLFPAARQIDEADLLPPGQLDALAAAGLYGAPGPPAAGGLGLDPGTVCTVAEELAGGCLATTFVWVQHLRLVQSLAADAAPAPLRAWLGPACRGELRGSLALAGLLPGPPRLSAREVADGWLLSGTAPWVTGWGLTNVLLVAARGPGDTIVTLLLDAAAQPGLAVTRQQLAAVHASGTVQLDFADVLVPSGRLLEVAPFDPAAAAISGLRLNGSLALGVARRCCQLIGPGPLDDELAACRMQLDEAEPEAMPDARAAASEFALRAAAALMAHAGSRSILHGEHPQRLAREALFLLVFGSRPGIRTGLLRRFGALPPG